MIKFYTTRGAYGAFSNFSKHSVNAFGRTWPTSEHLYQSHKFNDPSMQHHISTLKTPREAADYGRSNPMVDDWDDIKVDAMRFCLLQKFSQHESLMKLLLSTGDQEIVEDSPTDYFWGCGRDGSGANILGVLLMELRDQYND